MRMRRPGKRLARLPPHYRRMHVQEWRCRARVRSLRSGSLSHLERIVRALRVQSSRLSLVDVRRRLGQVPMQEIRTRTSLRPMRARFVRVRRRRRRLHVVRVRRARIDGRLRRRDGKVRVQTGRVRRSMRSMSSASRRRRRRLSPVRLLHRFDNGRNGEADGRRERNARQYHRLFVSRRRVATTAEYSTGV